LVVRLYLAQDYEDFTRPDGKNIEENFGVYYVKMWPQLIMKMSWLWFLMALYLDCLVVYPILAWTQRRYKNEPLGFQDAQLVLAQVFIFAVYAYLNIFILGDKTAYEW
jgi:hypothetical protein